MRNADIRIGHTYAAKVSGRVVPVRVITESPYGGWEAINLTTHRRIRVKSCQRFRFQIPDEPGPFPARLANIDTHEQESPHV